jgi:hypothetical protein
MGDHGGEEFGRRAGRLARRESVKRIGNWRVFSCEPNGNNSTGTMKPNEEVQTDDGHFDVVRLIPSAGRP